MGRINPETVISCRSRTNLKPIPPRTRRSGTDTIFHHVALTAVTAMVGRHERGVLPLTGAVSPMIPERPGGTSELALHRVGKAESPSIRRHAETRRRTDLRILFAGVVSKVAPLVFEHGIGCPACVVGRRMASETTSAAVGQVGIVRRARDGAESFWLAVTTMGTTGTLAVV